jgi:release factor glutamine methyltransferase
VGARHDWTVREVLAWTQQRFARADLGAARLDAELLLACALGCRRLDLYTDPERPLAEGERGAFRALIERRLQGEPVAYLVGRREFWSLDLEVDTRVLVPRPETETLVEEALDLLRGVPAPRLADVGTGSGAVALALRKERPDATVVATDASGDALRVAAQNACTLGLPLRLVAADLLAPIAAATLDLVASNPPYLRTDEIAGSLGREPRIALDGGPDGLRTIVRLIDQAASRLRPGGALCLEIAPDAADRVGDMLRAARWHDVRRRRDLGRRDRVVSARRGGN